MKKIKVVFLVIMLILTILPVIFMNFKVNCISEINNSRLPEININNLSGQEIDNYIQNRIGFHDEAISFESNLNQTLYGLLIHPFYCYGKEGYVYFNRSTQKIDAEFLDAFCSYLKKMQDYCEERNVPFIYCINPEKGYVYPEYLPEGYNQNDEFFEVLYKTLEKYKVNYISNMEFLREKAKTEQVYNIKYDAGHWNDLGAFYGTNNMIEKVKENFNSVKTLELEDFNQTTEIQQYLTSSKIEINEEVPKFDCKYNDKVVDITNKYSSIELNPSHKAFMCFKNENQGSENLPRVMFFHGSYYNRNRAFYESLFKETYAIHNYQNILNLDYYFNIFKPECVLLETASYATNRTYFDYDSLLKRELNLTLENKIKQSGDYKKLDLSEVDYKIETNGDLIKITFNMQDSCKSGYFKIDEEEFDLSIKDKKIECTMEVSKFNKENCEIYLFN